MITCQPVTQNIRTGLLQARMLVFGNGSWGKVGLILLRDPNMITYFLSYFHHDIEQIYFIGTVITNLN